MATNSSEKEAAFIAYDFEADERWTTYRTNLTIPPGRNEGDVIRRYKQKFYRQHIDSDYQIDPLPASTSSKAMPFGLHVGRDIPRSPGQSSPDSSTTSSFQRATSSPSASTSGSVPRGAASSSHAAPRGMAPAQVFDSKAILFLANAWVLVMAIVHYFPFTPSVLSLRAYKYTLFGAAFTYTFSIYLQYGVPSPMNLASIKAWFGRVAASSDFLSLLYCFIFVSNTTPIVLVVIPLGVVGLYQCSQHLKRNFSRAALYRSYLQKGCLWLEQNTTQIQLFSANAEVFVGFMLILRAFTAHRQLIQLLGYWQFLRLKYHAPSSSYYHRATWTMLHSKLAPLLRYAPFLNSPVQLAQRWFNRS